jgi:hypothetical protein
MISWVGLAFDGYVVVMAFQDRGFSCRSTTSCHLAEVAVPFDSELRNLARLGASTQL